MGTFNSSYVGIFILVKPKEVFKNNKFNVHPDTHKRVKTNDKFCPNTGVEYLINSETVSVGRPFNIYDLTTELDGYDEDELFEPAYSVKPRDFQLYILNGSDDEFRFSKPDNQDTVDFSDLPSIKDVVASFEVKYATLLDAIRNVTEEVIVSYGLVNYAH